MVAELVTQVEELLVDFATGQDTIRNEHKECDCPLPILKKAYNDYIGTAVVIRFCCALKALVELTGNDKIYSVREYEPHGTWRTNDIIEDHRTKELRFRGEPPPWLQDRLDRKNLPVDRG